MLTWLRGGSKKEVIAASVGSIEIREPWARAASNSPTTAGGFFTLVNNEAAPDRLVSASTPAARTVEIHAIRVAGPGITMAPLESGLAIYGNSTVTLKPRGYHLLLVGLQAPLALGASVPMTLVFEKAGSVEIALTVAASGPVGEKVLHEEGN